VSATQARVMPLSSAHPVVSEPGPREEGQATAVGRWFWGAAVTGPASRGEGPPGVFEVQEARAQERESATPQGRTARTPEGYQARRVKTVAPTR
jgi:hypothetical protein